MNSILELIYQLTEHYIIILIKKVIFDFNNGLYEILHQSLPVVHPNQRLDT